MKLLIENWRKYLNEIGEAALEPYSFERAPYPFGRKDLVVYEFSTPQEQYKVHLAWRPESMPEPAWDISYGTNTAHGGEATAEYKPLQVLSTIVAIIKDFIKNAGPDLGPVLNFRFLGIPKEDVPAGSRWQKSPTSRTKLYKRFLKHALKDYPGAKIIEDRPNEIRFKVPIERPLPGATEEYIDETPT